MCVRAADGVHPDNNCSYQEVLQHLQLSRSNELFSMTRPVRDYKRPTQVSLEVLLYAILDVVSAPRLLVFALSTCVCVIFVLMSEISFLFGWNKTQMLAQEGRMVSVRAQML